MTGCSIQQRKEAIEGYEKVGRPDSAEKERLEMEILNEYLPKEDQNAEKKARTE